MVVVIIIGGPPNSGKSTLAIRLRNALQDLGQDVKEIDLDLYAPTLEFIKGNISKEQRDALKAKFVSKEDLERMAGMLDDAAKEHAIVIGDAPGRYTEDLDYLLQHCTHGIILFRDDGRDQVKQWSAAFQKNGVNVVAIVKSILQGTETIRLENGVITGTVSGLDRTTTVTPGIRGLAGLLLGSLV